MRSYRSCYLLDAYLFGKFSAYHVVSLLAWLPCLMASMPPRVLTMASRPSMWSLALEVDPVNC